MNPNIHKAIAATYYHNHQTTPPINKLLHSGHCLEQQLDDVRCNNYKNAPSHTFA